VAVLNCRITSLLTWTSLWVLLIIDLLCSKACVTSASVAYNSTNDSFNFVRSSWVAVPNKDDNTDPTKGKIARLERLLMPCYRSNIQ